MGTASAVGVVGGFGAVIVLALGGPAWALAWLLLVVAAGVAFQLWRARVRDRRSRARL